MAKQFRGRKLDVSPILTLSSIWKGDREDYCVCLLNICGITTEGSNPSLSAGLDKSKGMCYNERRSS